MKIKPDFIINIKDSGNFRGNLFSWSTISFTLKSLKLLYIAFIVELQRKNIIVLDLYLGKVQLCKSL